MSRKDLVLVASRAFALLLTGWAAVDVTYLPDELFALFHHMSLRSAFATHDYWTSYYLLLTACNLVRILALSLGASLFWRCGPKVEALFSPQQDDQEPSAH